jgi:hypothetical protein
VLAHQALHLTTRRRFPGPAQRLPLFR